jgi:hypothetical protein
VLEYRSIDSWKMTVISSSWDPGVAGTYISVEKGEHSTFFAQAQRLFSRVITQDDPPEAPLRWVIPGLIDELPKSGFVSLASAVGTIAFTERDAQLSAVRPDGTKDVLSGISVVFAAATRLPASVKYYHDGALTQSYAFEVLSRP